MAQNKAVNTLENSLIRTSNKTKQPKGSYSYALNTVVSDTVIDNSSRENEKGFDVYIQLPIEFEYTILGCQWLGTEEYVLFIKEVSGVSNQIWYINKNVTRLVISNPDLSWKDNKQISSTYRIDYKGHRIVYFIDGINDDRVIDIDESTQPSDVSLISLQTSYNRATASIFTSDTGGSLQSGQYFIALSYGLNTDFNSSIFGISKPISIAQEDYMSVSATVGTIPESINQKFGNVSGSILGTPTKKSFRITISNIDTTFDYINIIVVQYTTNGYKIKVVRNINISERETINYTYTGFEGVEDSTLDLSDIIIDNIKYYASEVIAQKENRLIRGNSKLKESPINYQAIANEIKINYKITEDLIFSDDLINYPTKELDPASYDPLKEVHKKQSTSSGYMNFQGTDYTISKSFMRDEVYSLGIGFELKDGTETDVFHIPGRAYNEISGYGVGENGRTIVSNWDDININGNTWRDINTAVKDANDLAYWRSNEVYPDGYGYPTNGEKDSSGRSYIRHHRMPSDILEPLYRTNILGNPNTANTESKYEIYRRNLTLTASNINIPDEYKDKISKIKIYYTPRTDANKRIRAKGLLYPLRDKTEVTKRQPRHFSYEDPSSEDNKLFEFVSPDTLFRFKDLPLSASKLRVVGIDKAYVNYVGIRMRGVKDTPLNYKVTYFNNDLFDTQQRSQRITTGVGFYNQRTRWKGDLVGVRSIDKLIYVDRNFNGNTEGLNLNFSGGQNTVVVSLQQGLKFFAAGETPASYPELQFPTGSTEREVLLKDINYQENGNVDNTDMAMAPYVVEKVYYDTAFYTELINTNESLYGSVLDLDYIDSKNFITYTGSSLVNIEINSGDTYIDTFNFKSTSIDLVDPEKTNGTIDPEKDETNVATNEIMIQSLGSFITESDLNIRMRTYGNGDTIENDERFFPKRFYNLSTLREYGRSANVPEYYNIQPEYNTQYLQKYFANNRTLQSFLEYTGDVRYANRLIYSPKQNLESKIDSYRASKANDYRDIQSDKGPITGIFIKQENLFAITRDSLFNVYASSQTIQTESEENITVGTGEFFGIEPTEVISIEGGFGGTSSKFSIAESPYGYLFVDRHKSKVILFTDQLRDLNIMGINEDFTISLYKQFPNLAETFDSPTTVGISSIYDPLRKRLLITKKDYELIDFSGTITTLDGYIYRNGIKLDYDNSNEFINKSFTVSYDCIQNKWISYHSYIPKNYLNHSTNYLIYDGEIKRSEGSEYLPFILEVVVNENPLVEKVLDSITTNVTNEDRKRRFFDEAIVYSSKQISGTIPFYSNNVLNPSLLSHKEDDWNFKQFLDVSAENNLPLFTTDWNSLKLSYPIDKVINPLAIDNSKPWNKKGRIRDKYFVIRFTAKNLELTKIIINFVTSSYRISNR